MGILMAHGKPSGINESIYNSMDISISVLRMERQHLTKQADESEYEQLYRDMQPGQPAYWHGFGNPPLLSYRAAFDDTEYNRLRQLDRRLVKGRFQGGNVGWVDARDMELFAGLCRKPLDGFSFAQQKVLQMVEHAGPITIQQIKEETGFLVKEITPVLHRLQQAFLVYEDQYDGDWERGWYRFEEMFPDVDLERYSRQEALEIILQRYAYRMVYLTVDMARNYYRISKKELKEAVNRLAEKGILHPYNEGYLLRRDYNWLCKNELKALSVCCLLHRNDILVRSVEPVLKKRYQRPGFEALYYLLADGEFHGAVLGKYKFGPDIIEALMIDREYWHRRDEIAQLVHTMPGCQESNIQNIVEV